MIETRVQRYRREQQQRWRRQVIIFFVFIVLILMMSIRPPEKSADVTGQWRAIDRNGDYISDAELRHRMILQTVQMGQK